MHSVVTAFHEELFVERDAAVATGIKFDHPTAYAGRSFSD